MLPVYMSCYLPTNISEVHVHIGSLFIWGSLDPGGSHCILGLSNRGVTGWGGHWNLRQRSPPPNHRALDWFAVLTIRRLCPIVLQDNIVVSNKHNWPEFYPGLPGTLTEWLSDCLRECLVTISRGRSRHRRRGERTHKVGIGMAHSCLCMYIVHSIHAFTAF